MLRDSLAVDPVLTLGPPLRIIEVVSFAATAKTLSNDWIAVDYLRENGAISNRIKACVNEQSHSGKVVTNRVLVELNEVI